MHKSGRKRRTVERDGRGAKGGFNVHVRPTVSCTSRKMERRNRSKCFPETHWPVSTSVSRRNCERTKIKTKRAASASTARQRRNERGYKNAWKWWAMSEVARSRGNDKKARGSLHTLRQETRGRKKVERKCNKNWSPETRGATGEMETDK